MENSFGLSEITIEELLNYFKSKPEIELVKIYGSRAKGTFHNGSDIDFAIWATENTDFSKIAGELYDLPTPYKFDVTNYKTLTHENLKASIDNDGIEFYKIAKK